MSKLSPFYRPVLALGFALGLLLPCAATAAPLTVSSTYSLNGSLFSYNFTIANTSLPDLLSVTLSVPAQANAVQNLAAPGGFSAFFDPGVGLVDFVSDTLPFSVGSSISGFSFQSPFQLGAIPFSALSLDARQNPVVTTGAVSPAPEPASLGVLGFAFLSAIGVYRRRATRLVSTDPLTVSPLRAA